MSFFDDDDFDEPTHVADAAPRRDGARGRAFGGFGGGGGGRTTSGGIDPQTARTRQLVALGVTVVVLILLVFAVRGCVNGGRTSALKDYSRDVTAVLQESSSDVSVPMFRALSSGEDANTIATTLQRLRATAESQASRVKKFSEPGDDNGKAAQRDLELAMNLRASAVRVIAERIPAAKADGGTAEGAINQIAGQIQAFLASDVVVLQRTKPLIDQALAAKGVSGADVSAPRTVTDVTWLDPAVVTTNLAGGGGTSSAGGSSSSPVKDRSGDTPTEAGSHGTGITGVTFGDTTLTSGTDATVTGNVVTVAVENQGGFDESNVEVGVTFTASGGKPVFVKKTVPSISQGQTQNVPITLPATVKSGQSGKLDVQVGGVPGEASLDNNKASYTVTIGG